MLQDVVRVSDLEPFVQELFAEDATLVSRVLHGILKAQSPRLSDISHSMEGTSSGANYKALNRFVRDVDPWMPLLRLFDEDAPFVLGDVTEIARPQAKKTSYVGTLKDGQTRGFWVLTLGTPRGGRAIPFHVITYSSQTISDEVTSRNHEHRRALERVSELMKGVPIVFDREFEALLKDLKGEKQPFVIRLNTGNGVKLTDKEGNPIELSLSPGKRVTVKNVYYKGTTRVNLAGRWKPGCKQPLWVMTTLDPEKGLELYEQRMKIEESFKDLKSLLHLDKLMNKDRERMEKMIALTLIAYALAVGEAIRDTLYREKNGSPIPLSSSF